MKTRFLSILLWAILACYATNSNAQANQMLSNLSSPTDINQTLRPDGNNTRDLGSSTRGWRYIYLASRLYLNGSLAIHAPGTDNFFAGRLAGNTSVTGARSTGIGRYALTNLTVGNDNTAIGARTLYNNGSGWENTALGSYALYANTSGSGNTASGYRSLNDNTTGFSNTAIGCDALNDNTTGANNTATGRSALANNLDASYNTATGYEALVLNTTGYENTATGANALWHNTTGELNSAHGAWSLYSNTSGFSNTASGYEALYSNQIGTSNTANGAHAMYDNTAGEDNTGSGYQALRTNTTGSRNTADGFRALYDNTTGIGNTALGYGADVSAGNLTNATAIGYEAIVTASNRVRIGNGNVTSIGGQVGWTNFSDGRYKKNVTENVAGLPFIKSLRPVTYTINVAGLNDLNNKGRKQPLTNKDQKEDVEKTKAAEEASKIVYSGFVAQEVEEAARKINFEFSGVDRPREKDGLYGLRYADFVVPLVKAVQELSKQNEDLQKQIDELKNLVLLKGSTQPPAIIGFSNGSLEQNKPNPFKKSTVINYTLPEQSTTAQILITDMNAKLLKQVNVSGSGKQTLEVDAATLAAGAYNYSLMVDGRIVGTKQMILAR